MLAMAIFIQFYLIEINHRHFKSLKYILFELGYNNAGAAIFTASNSTITVFLTKSECVFVRLTFVYSLQHFYPSRAQGGVVTGSIISPKSVLAQYIKSWTYCCYVRRAT